MALLLTAQPAMAHPHIFVKYEVEITRKDKDNFGLHFIFKMHNVVTPNPLYMDQSPVTENLIEALGQHPFYLFMDMDGHMLGQQNVDLTRAGGTDDEPVYTFDMDVPADTGSFGFSIYDSEYYDSVSLDGADALKIKVSSLTCSIISQEVAKTMWGINRAAHVECGDKSKPLPSVSPLKHNQFEEPHLNASPLGNQMMVP
ncbi:MAG: DUF1007 family protein [Alphaproteobacteria bacterium]